jgi:hypothetical protein
MSKISSKQRVEQVKEWVSWISKQKGYLKTNKKVKKELED